jgi:hypothetical protein
LKFDNSETLQEVYNYLAGNQSRIPNFLSKIKGFTSLSTACENIKYESFKSLDELQRYSDIAYLKKDALGEAQVQKMVSSPIYSLLFNDKAILKVGKEVIKADKNDTWYFFDPIYLDKLSEYRNYRDIPNVRVQNARLNRDLRLFGEVFTFYTSGNPITSDTKRRIQCRNFQEVVLIVNPITAISTLVGTARSELSTHDQKKFLGAWWWSNATTLSVSSAVAPLITGSNVSTVVTFDPGGGFSATGIVSTHMGTESSGSKTASITF